MNDYDTPPPPRARSFGFLRDDAKAHAPLLTMLKTIHAEGRNGHGEGITLHPNTHTPASKPGDCQYHYPCSYLDPILNPST
jgi:hypothetical protein